MSPDQQVKLKDGKEVREAVRKYLADNIGFRAEDRDLVWSQRYVVAKLSLLAGKTMLFTDLESIVRSSLAETSHDMVRSLTPELIAEKICDAFGPPPPAREDLRPTEHEVETPQLLLVTNESAEEPEADTNPPTSS